MKAADNVLPREGERWMVNTTAEKRKATYSDIELLSDVTKQIEGHTICALEKDPHGLFKGYSAISGKEVESRCREEPIIKK